MNKQLKRVLSSVVKLPLSAAEKKQLKNVFRTGAVESGLLSSDDAKRQGK